MIYTGYFARLKYYERAGLVPIKHIKMVTKMV